MQKRKEQKFRVEGTAQNKTVEIKRVESYKYLGSRFHEEDGNVEEGEERIEKGNMIVCGKGNEFIKIKKVAKVIVFSSTVTTACETWVLTKDIINRLDIWQILSWIVGGNSKWSLGKRV